MIHGKFEDPQPESHLLLASRLGQLFYVVKKVHGQTTTFVRDKHDLVHQLFDHEKKMFFFVFLKYPARNFNIYQEWAIFFEPVSSPLPKHDCMVSMFSFWGCILKGFTKRAGQV